MRKNLAPINKLFSIFDGIAAEFTERESRARQRDNGFAHLIPLEPTPATDSGADCCKNNSDSPATATVIEFREEGA